MSYSEKILQIDPSPHPLIGRPRLPGDKSISHRAAILAALAEGESTLTGFCTGLDCLTTLRNLEQLGVAITQDQDTVYIQGVGLKGLSPSCKPLDCENSGTTARLLMGLLATQGFESYMIGDASLSKRPMRRVAEPLAAMGANIVLEKGTLPATIFPAQLKGIQQSLQLPSNQVKSAILLAALGAQGTTYLEEPIASRDHLERLFPCFGVKLGIEKKHLVVPGRQTIKPTTLNIPQDISAAAFLIVGAALAAGSCLHFSDLGLNPLRLGCIEILKQMGASIDFEITNTEAAGGYEPVGTLKVMGERSLKAVEVGPEWAPITIDEYPALFMAAAGAEGKTIFYGIEELRHKESDRITTMLRALTQLGVKATEHKDTVEIIGQRQFQGGAVLEAAFDHRIAMALSLAAIKASESIYIQQATAATTVSFPAFIGIARQLGLRIIT